MLHPHKPIRLNATKPFWRGALFCACILAMTSLSKCSLAAGCRAHTNQFNETFEGGQAGHLPEWSWWTAGPVQRTYESGRFFYYQVASELMPCNGPHCRGSEPTTSLAIQPLVESNKLNIDILTSSQGFSSNLMLGWLPACDDRSPASPALIGLLRPPIIAAA